VVEGHDLGDRLREMTSASRPGLTVTVEQEELYRGTDRYNLYAVR